MSALENRRSLTGADIILMMVAFLGIFVYGLLAALPGTVLPTLERSQFLPTDNSIGWFLWINGIGAVLAYLVSGPVTDRIGKKFTLSAGAALVVVSLVGFALTVTQVTPSAALPLVFACSLVLGLGANAIVSAGHALVADVASTWRNAALNLLDICFGLGLMALPLIVRAMESARGTGLVFWSLGGATLVLMIFVLIPRFPKPAHPESFPISEAAGLIRIGSFWILGIALFMYVGAEVSVAKWVTAFMERDPKLLSASGVDPSSLQGIAPEALSQFFDNNPLGKAVAAYALATFALFALALLIGRLISSLLLGVAKVNPVVLLLTGSVLTALSLILLLNSSTPGMVRVAVMAAGFGMGPIFPTSVGLASVMAPRISGTAMSLVMGLGFAGLLAIPPAIGFISNKVGGKNGDVRTGLYALLAGAIIMVLLHIVLVFRMRGQSARAIPAEAVAGAE